MKKGVEIDGDFRGKVSFEDIKFKKYYTRIVRQANKKKTSGQIYLPKEFINKMVYILLPQEQAKKK